MSVIPPCLPKGTQIVATTLLRDEKSGEVVSSWGKVGVIIFCGERNHGAPTDIYRVRFADGVEKVLFRRDFRLRKEVQSGLVADDYDYAPHVVYRCVVGSRAYDLAGEESDTDVRGVFLPTADRHWSLRGVPEQIERANPDAVYWEFGKFVQLALKANPSILECLWTDIVVDATSFGLELRAQRDVFLSKLIHTTYNGYALRQFKKIGDDLRLHGKVRWKHAMHLCRLLLAGEVAMREGRVALRVPEHRDRLLAIRRGEVPWEEVDRWRQELHRTLDAAYERTALPDRPDDRAASALLVAARRSMVDR